jgi:hypothetical protein
MVVSAGPERLEPSKINVRWHMALPAVFIKFSVPLLLSLTWLAKKGLPNLQALWAGIRPMCVGEIVSWRNGGNFQVLKRRGKPFTYEYMLVNIEGISPWLLPALPHDPRLWSNAPVFWYKGSKGRCYLKRMGAQCWN